MHINTHEGIDHEVLMAGTQAANANGTGVSISSYRGKMKALLVSGAGAGTGLVTLDVYLQHSDELSANYTNLNIAFNQVTNGAAASQSQPVDTRTTKKYVRAVSNVAGTNAAFGATLVLLGRKQIK